jgi:uncharacterized protein YndB with AHSA1/START domain
MPARTAGSNIAPANGLNELTITEILNAPRSLTWRSWTDARHVAEWWGPAGFTNPVCEWDARPGGLIRIDMQAPDGSVVPMRGIFHDVREPEWLDFTTTSFADGEGPDQLQVRHNVTFDEQDGKTILTLQSRVVETISATTPFLAGMEDVWNQSLDRLAELLKSSQFEKPLVHFRQHSKAGDTKCQN